jgi:hypothetical protein
MVGGVSTKEYFRWMFTEAGRNWGGLFDYWRDVSYGRIDLTGSRVFGWYTMPYTLEEQSTKSRGQNIQDCVNSSHVNVAGYYSVAAIVNVHFDGGAAGGRVLGNPYWPFWFFQHETGHAYGLEHSRNTAGGCEYCDKWDIMSAGNVHSFTGLLFGDTGPGLNAAYLQALGWLPAERTARWTPGSAAQSFTLAALNHPESSGSLAVEIPLPDGRRYTIELRRQDEWDQGIPRDAVLMHEIRPRDGHSYLFDYRPGPEYLPGEIHRDYTNQFQITVVGINSAASTAEIRIDYLPQEPSAQPQSGGSAGGIGGGTGIRTGKFTGRPRGSFLQ